MMEEITRVRGVSCKYRIISLRLTHNTDMFFRVPGSPNSTRGGSSAFNKWKI